LKIKIKGQTKGKTFNTEEQGNREQSGGHRQQATGHSKTGSKEEDRSQKLETARSFHLYARRRGLRMTREWSILFHDIRG